MARPGPANAATTNTATTDTATTNTATTNTAKNVAVPALPGWEPVSRATRILKGT